MFEARLHIGGVCANAIDDAVFQRHSPVDGQPVTKAAAAGPKDAVTAANSAAAAFSAWMATDISEKQRILTRARDLMVERSDELIEAAHKELGSTTEWTQFNIDVAAKVFDEAIAIPQLLAAPPLQSTFGPIESTLIRQPVGVVLAIAPWNAAVTLAIRAIVWPLACGNSIVFKASELCPKLHALIVDILCDAGLPAGAICSVLHPPEAAEAIVEALAAHPAIRRINFTGSTRTGRRVAEIAATHLKPCLLELSGKAPLIVLEDADLEAASVAAAYGGYFNQGQICMATERVVTVGPIADDFVARLRDHCEALSAKRNEDKIGDLISVEAARRVEQLIKDALAKGAVLVSGGKVVGAHVQPTLLDHVTPDMQIYSEESFGPVVSIVRALDQDEAVTIANDTEYGLVASVYTADEARGMTIAAQLETGACHINGPTVYDDPAMPFGGVKSSGYGRFGGQTAIEEFTELRWITAQQPNTDFKFWT